ncbi:MAG: ABC transporter permease [Deltaproteobacteria bacterium]|nr:ABC transporter permease [Deltaproteobacteria bacterium]MBW2418563.1 ABC transporter permease [Deltaproteobacteria bacterium]
MRRVGVILFVLGQSALRGLVASRVTSTVAVLTIAIALLLVGAFALVVGNMHGLLEHFGEELQVTAYLDADLSEQDQRNLAQRAATIEGVERVEWVTKEEAWERFSKSLGGSTLLEGLDENPLPASLELRLLPRHRTPEGLAIVEESLDGLPGVDDLSRGQEWVEGYARAASLLRSAAIGLGGVLGVAALLIVANTIRLALYAREDELEILSLVGASRTFVRIPFLLEGTIQGALGGLLAVALLYVAFQLLVPQLRYGLELLLGNTEPRFFGGPGVLRLVVSGAALGMLGSVTALVGWRQR